MMENDLNRLTCFLKILKIDEKQFYEIIKKQVVFPHKMISFEEFSSKKSNFFPEDIKDWFKNLNEYFNLRLWSV